MTIEDDATTLLEAVTTPNSESPEDAAERLGDEHIDGLMSAAITVLAKRRFPEGTSVAEISDYAASVKELFPIDPTGAIEPAVIAAVIRFARGEKDCIRGFRRGEVVLALFAATRLLGTEEPMTDDERNAFIAETLVLYESAEHPRIFGKQRRSRVEASDSDEVALLKTIAIQGSGPPREQANRLGAYRSLMLVSFALTVAAEREIPEGSAAAVSEYVANLRQRFPDVEFLKPVAAEALLRAALGLSEPPEVTYLNEAGNLLFFLAHVMLTDMALTDEQLDEVIEKVLELEASNE